MAPSALERLRAAGLSVEIAGGELQVEPASKLTRELRDLAVAHRDAIRSDLLREAMAEALELAAVDRGTGDPELSATDPADVGQVRRLRELARHPAFGAERDQVAEIVEEAVEGGLSEAGAYQLIGELGRRIAARSGDRRGGPQGGTCQDCGRRTGPTSTRCGRCKRRGQEAGT